MLRSSPERVRKSPAFFPVRTNGCWSFSAKAKVIGRSRRYEEDTLVLQTDAETKGGAYRITDFMPIRRGDLSSLVRVFHAAAPCPVPVKAQMMEWWGPIIWEYYAGTEGNGMCIIGAEEWLAHPGSVGRGTTAEVLCLLLSGSTTSACPALSLSIATSSA